MFNIHSYKDKNTSKTSVTNEFVSFKFNISMISSTCIFNTACPQVNDMKLYRITGLRSNAISVVGHSSNILCWKLNYKK